MAILVKDGLAMRLTRIKKRLAQAAMVAAAWAASSGCQRLPYIDQSKAVPHENLGTIGDEDKEVTQAQFLSSSMALPMPKVQKPRTTNDPEAQEIWELTLPDAIRVGLDNSEVVRVISLGAQGIPVGGFEPTPLNNGAGSGIASALGASPLQTVYDPAIQETQIAQALSTFDTNFTTSLLWGHSVAPFNNAISAGTIVGASRFPIIFDQDTAQFQTGVQKRTATGAQLGVTHNISYLYSNSPTNATPSAYTTNLQLSLTQPLLGSAPLAGGQAGPPVGLEANRAPIVIARLNADAAVWRFKAEIMAHVRSIEQQYWSLAQQHVQLWSSEKAVELAEEIKKREESELEVGRGTVADVAEATQRLEQFRLDLVTKTSDVITTERQLRNILGLPPADSRRIVPVTAPSEARLQPDWDSSVAQMLSFQPDIVSQQLVVRVAELQLLISRNQLLPVLNFNALYQFNGLGADLDSAESVMTGRTIRAIDPLISQQQRAAGLNASPGNFNNFQSWQVGFTFQMPLGMRAPLANTRQSQYILLKQRAYLQQIVHQTTHSLSRFFLEVDANYKQFKTASRLRAAAAQRLEAQRAFYEEGRITIDRYLDAVSQYASAVAQEAQFKTTYNISIVALEEAKGTLLAYDNIAVAEGPHPKKAYVQARDQQAAHRQLPVGGEGNYAPRPITGPPGPDPVAPMVSPGAEPTGPIPLLPAPVGPLGPPATPVNPTVPAGEPPILSRSAPSPTQPSRSVPAPVEPEVIPASATTTTPASIAEGDNDLPPLPVSIELPPLPPQ
ncbi:TolC family protein [Singulisphaera sp. Ch08]|uniref:TolC family protein n=1 Tax=Singulisphaera sp. Ch08 TaxID=3120278 RepID=A0AAU7CBV2_9BACT